jgi:hypothetical protein
MPVQADVGCHSSQLVTLREGISQKYDLSVVVNFALDGMCSMNYSFPHLYVIPKYVKPIAFTLNDLPCEDKLGNVTIQTSVPNITTLSVVVNFALDGMCSMNYSFPFSLVVGTV